MSIFIFVIVLAILILVHEFGHFLAAKKSGVRVDEFGIGFPPRLFKLFNWRGTDFTFNMIPFGGFVKIFGENPTEEELPADEKNVHFSHKPKITQAFILSAGVLFNILFAWILISFGFVYGLPTPEEADSPRPVENAELVITSVLPDSPAEKAGIKTGDVIISTRSQNDTLEEINPESVSSFISAGTEDEAIFLDIKRGEETLEFQVLAEDGVIEDKKAIGVSMGMIGTLKLPIHLAFWEGTKTTVTLLGAITVGLFTFFTEAVLGKADFSQIAGPVGIVGLVGDASQLGFIFLLQFTAFISLNLAIINLIPFPALDGGRLLFLLIEAVKGSRINPKVANTLNALGFLLLIILMLVVTINDIQKLF